MIPLPLLLALAPTLPFAGLPGPLPPSAGASQGPGGPSASGAPASRPPGTRSATQEEPLPPGVAARVGDAVITFDEYEAYLVRTLGRRPLQELVDARLIEDEARRLELRVDPEELDGEVERFWQSMHVRHGGDSAGLQSDLAAEGFTAEEYKASYRERRRVEMLADLICVATRNPDEADVRERFDREFGKDGVRVEVRHIYFNPARLRNDLTRQGVPAQELTGDELARRIDTIASAALERLRGGAEFGEVARELSHDISVKTNDGLIPGYNYRRYGEELADAVRAAEVGVPVGPVHTPAGVHVIEVLSRKETAFEDVREDVRAMLMSDPATGTERQALRIRLRVARPVRIY